MRPLQAGRTLFRWTVFVHRWLGAALCLLFLLWFLSGIVLMYWDFPEVSAALRLQRSAPLNPATIGVSPAEAFSLAGQPDSPFELRLSTLDARPVYRFGTERGEALVYADTGELPGDVSQEMMGRVASAWTGQMAADARVEQLAEVDQWTVQGQFRTQSPLWKYSWPNGEQVYVSETSGNVVQYTTPNSRLGAYLGAIPHWLYFTPLRRHGLSWGRVVIRSSGLGTLGAVLGLVIGVWVFSPTSRYRRSGKPAMVPYRGQMRWHAVLGLIFGVAAVTWVFSGMLSMEPFERQRTSGGDRDGARRRGEVLKALRGPVRLADFEDASPREALLRVANSGVKELEWVFVAGEPAYLATLDHGESLVVPLHGAPKGEFDRARIVNAVRQAAGTDGLADMRTLTQYDRYYLDRRRARPLPVILVRLKDGLDTRYYVDPKTARVVGGYNSREWASRWLYHGLHSLDFPWLYNHRPLWDVLMITLLAGGAALSVTSLLLAWQVVGRTLRLAARRR